MGNSRASLQRRGLRETHYTHRASVRDTPLPDGPSRMHSRAIIGLTRPQHPFVGRIEASLRRSLLFVVACCAAAQQQPVFHSQTRLVEVDVVIRDKNGPVTGLTKDDFTLYDCRDSQRDLNHAKSNPPCRFNKQLLAVFREVNSGSGGAPVVSAFSPLPPGTVSNRLDSGGKPTGAATVVVIDQLNTPFGLKGHQRLELTKFLESAGDRERIAVYSLGEDLHLLQDFTSDPKKLLDSVTRIDAGDRLSFGGGGDANIEAA